MTDLETRMHELEEALSVTDPGSVDYEHIAKDYATLAKSWNETRKTDAEIREQENRTEIEKRKSGWKTKAAEIALGTLIPMVMVMGWEYSGRLLPRSPMSWIKRR